jgi:hypothetical protein
LAAIEVGCKLQARKQSKGKLPDCPEGGVFPVSARMRPTAEGMMEREYNNAVEARDNVCSGRPVRPGFSIFPAERGILR